MILLIIGQCLVLTIIVLVLDDIGYRAAFDRLHRHCGTWWTGVVRPKLIESQWRQAHIDGLEQQIIALGEVPVAAADVTPPATSDVDGLRPNFGNGLVADHDRTAEPSSPPDDPSEERSYRF